MDCPVAPFSLHLVNEGGLPRGLPSLSQAEQINHRKPGPDW